MRARQLIKPTPSATELSHQIIRLSIIVVLDYCPRVLVEIKTKFDGTFPLEILSMPLTLPIISAYSIDDTLDPAA